MLFGERDALMDLQGVLEMNSASRQRVREVQRNARRKKQRQYRIRRIGALIILVLLLILIIAGIRGCNKNTTAKGPVVTVLPAITIPPATKAPTANAVGNVKPSDVDQSYFADSCFVGNSVIESMEIYELVDNADYFARIGLNVTDAAKLAMTNSNIPVIDELNNDRQYKRIFMMFGENELNWPNIETFKSAYTSLIKKAKQYQPSAQIYLLSVTPISKKADSEQTEGVSKSAILKFNQYIEEIAKTNNVTYVDLYTALADKDGFLPEGVATDGIHFDKDYYTKCLVYIQTNYQ